MVFFYHNRPAPKGFALYPYSPMPTTNPCDNCNAVFISERARAVVCEPCDWWNESSCSKKYEAEKKALRDSISQEEADKIRKNFHDSTREWFTWKEFFIGVGITIGLIMLLKYMGVIV